MTALYAALTITQLFVRQAQIHDEMRRAFAQRNLHPSISAEWQLWNDLGNGLAEDLTDVGAEIGTRVRGMIAETQAAIHPGGGTARVPMACTTCGQPVMEIPGTSDPARGGAGTEWAHKNPADISACQRGAGQPVKARVDA